MSEQRQHPRHSVSWRVAIILEGHPKPIPAKAQEVSASGAGLFMPLVLPSKTRCKLIFEVPSTDYRTRQYVEVAAVAVYTTLVGNISQHRTGFLFLQICEALIKYFGDNQHHRPPKDHETAQDEKEDILDEISAAEDLTQSESSSAP